MKRNRWVRILIDILLIAAVVLLIKAIARAEYEQDEDGTYIAYVICMPGDYLNIRPFPSTKHEATGWLEAGDMVYMDGRKKNGFVHCIGLSTEAGEGWVYAGYLVSEKPELVNSKAVIVSKGRLAARKYVNGKRTRWLKPMAKVTVYYRTDEWSLTNCGYVRSEYLELEDV